MRGRRINSAKSGRIRAAILDWLGVPVSLTDTAAWAEINPPVVSGVTVSAETMLTISAVWACARLISETISTLPLSMYEKASNGKRVAPLHPLHSIIHDQPNPDSTAAVYWESTVAAMLLRGTARAEKLMMGERLVGLRFLDPRRLGCTRRPDGSIEYRYTDDNWRQRVIAVNRIWNLPGFSLDGRNGASVVSFGARVFGNALASDTAASKTFENGLHPTTVWKYPKVLSPTQREETRSAIKSLSGAVNAGNPAVLEAGMDVTTVGIDPVDAQLLESRGFSVEEVCRWFRVPPFMVGHSEKSTSWGTGIEQQMIGFLTFTLAPWLKKIEQAISKDLLSPQDRLRFYPKFNVEGLLRADSAGRSAFYGVMVDKGILTRDEVRALEDREPMGGNAGVLTVQSAMTALDSISPNTDATNARAALRALLGLDDAPAGN